MVQVSIREGRAAQAATPEPQPAATQAAEDRLPRSETMVDWKPAEGVREQGELWVQAVGRPAEQSTQVVAPGRWA